jgi:hypothetical protein
VPRANINRLQYSDFRGISVQNGLYSLLPHVFIIPEQAPTIFFLDALSCVPTMPVSPLVKKKSPTSNSRLTSCSDPTDGRGISVQNGPILASTASKATQPMFVASASKMDPSSRQLPPKWNHHTRFISVQMNPNQQPSTELQRLSCQEPKEIDLLQRLQC